jgi:hypothetical protein
MEKDHFSELQHSGSLFGFGILTSTNKSEVNTISGQFSTIF